MIYTYQQLLAAKAFKERSFFVRQFLQKLLAYSYFSIAYSGHLCYDIYCAIHISTNCYIFITATLGGPVMFELQLAKIWEQALEITRHDVSKPTFDTWFKDTELMAYYGDTLVIKTPNEYCKNTLENSYYHILQKNLEELLEHNIKLTFITPKETGADTLAAELLPKASNAPACQIKEEPVFTEPLFQEQLDFSNFNLNPKYTFDSFVIGKGNNFAYAACVAVKQ